MLFKEKSFVEDRVHIRNYSKSSFSISFRNSGPTGATVYKFERDGGKLVSRQRRSYGGHSKPCFNEDENWKSFRLEFKYLDCLPGWSKKSVNEEIPASIRRLYLWDF